MEFELTKSYKATHVKYFFLLQISKDKKYLTS